MGDVYRCPRCSFTVMLLEASTDGRCPVCDADGLEPLPPGPEDAASPRQGRG